MKLKVPPPVWAVCVAFSTLAASRFLAPVWPSDPLVSSIALALAVLGTGIDVSAKGLFIREGTTVNPLSPGAAALLVRTGAYRWSRNPMYLGRILQLLALALYMANWVGLLGVLGFAAYLDRVQIQAEEEALSKRFPADYPVYRQSVRRWF